MQYESKPKLHALVCYYCAPFGCLTEPKVMPLEDAVDHARFGAAVLVDPDDEWALASWERAERMLEQETKRRKRWFDRD